jgi:hypothetical protein
MNHRRLEGRALRKVIMNHRVFLVLPGPEGREKTPPPVWNAPYRFVVSNKYEPSGVESRKRFDPPPPPVGPELGLPCTRNALHAGLNARLRSHTEGTANTNRR